MNEQSEKGNAWFGPNGEPLSHQDFGGSAWPGGFGFIPDESDEVVRDRLDDVMKRALELVESVKALQAAIDDDEGDDDE
jgi:hypothetical protein